MKKSLIALIIAVLLCGSQIDVSNLAGQFGFRGLMPYKVATAAIQVTVDNEEDLINELYTGLLNRENEIIVDYSIPGYKINMDELYRKIIAINDKKNPKDSDYLAYSVKGWNVLVMSDSMSTTLDLTPVYKTSLKDEIILDVKVKSVLKELKLEKASQEQKVKAIHDYIINRVSYDSSLQKSSAYDAMMDRSAVCEGYSMLAYRMFTEAGLESRIISGTGDGVAHAWNIVKVSGKWYNIDLTWDDPVSAEGEPVLTYDYYLKSTKDFKDHKRDAKYKTEKFVKAYPISKISYPLGDE